MTDEAAPPAAAGPFATPVAELRGVGPARAAAFAERGLTTALDLLLEAPLRYAAPPPLGDLGAAAVGDDCSVAGLVTSAQKGRARNGRPFADLKLDVGGVAVRMRFFNRGWFADRAPRGTFVLAWGRFAGGATPTFSGVGLTALRGPEDVPAALARLEPVHPRVAGVAEGTLRRVLREALALVEAAPDPLPDEFRAPLNLPALKDALRLVHEPATREEAADGGARLVFDRLLALALAARGAAAAPSPAPELAADERVRERIRARLPFALTPGQEAALAEIWGDLARPVAMRRLLLGDVGSGKTAVAAGALLAAIARGAQALLVAPTEVLAAQHARTFGKWLEGSRVKHGLLTARTPRPERERLIEAGAAGELDLLIGTHAALADGVALPRLGLAVVDEQHRFGVLQRLRARAKAERPHLLAMSATPIPRSLALALFGDLSVSRLPGRPSGRPSPTAEAADLATAFAALRAAVARGERGMLVFPTINGETAAAVEREGRAWAKKSGPLGGLRLAWLHGGLPPAERDAAFAAFRTGAADVLVATTIVEVGVDVPEATTMVVVGADRFGLATLHQLRGRVGRGERPGRVYLVPGCGPDDPAGNRRPSASSKAADAAARLKLLASETDGLKLAEADLLLRGPGDFCGVRQHGHGGALPLGEGRDRGFVDAAAATARALLDRGYDPSRDPYYGRLATALGGARFEPPDAV